MNKCLLVPLALSLAVGAATMTTACTPGNNTPGATATGAVAGGLLGAALFHGSGAWMGVAAGAILGGVIGNNIGKRMDEEDNRNMHRAIETLPVGEEARWTNRHDITYVVVPVREYHREHRFCREYRTRVLVDGRWHTAYGTACRDNGRWRIYNPPRHRRYHHPHHGHYHHY